MDVETEIEKADVNNQTQTRTERERKRGEVARGNTIAPLFRSSKQARRRNTEETPGDTSIYMLGR